MTRIRKIAVSCAVGVATLGLAVVTVGCSSSAAGNVNAVLEDAPPVMPAGHEGRYVDLGVEGCYGCHGTNSQGKTMLATAPALPEDHLTKLTGENTEEMLARLNGETATESSKKVSADHAVCITCHVPGEAVLAAAAAVSQ